MKSTLLACLMLVASSTVAQAQPVAPAEIPDALKPWQAWVLNGHEAERCPFLASDKGVGTCAWPSALTLELTAHGGRFTQKWRTYRQTWVALPGDDKAWPQDVRVDGKPAVVASPEGPDDDSPAIYVTAGDHTVTGVFAWDDLPEALAVPPLTGLLSLTVQGTRLLLPQRDDQGRVLLGKTATRVEADVLDLTVQRQVSDAIPLVLTTRLSLRVSGRGREVLLGRALPDGFVPMSIESSLPARVEPDGRLRVQVRAGTWELTLVARHEGPVTALRRPTPDGEWPPEEVWAFEARPDLRLVTIEGVNAIDPQQTSIPDAWKRLPCYPMKPGDEMRLVEHRRGDADPAPDRLQLRRELWLDFDGGGYTASDTISGTLNRAWRLEVDGATELGRVAVGGKDQFITRSGAGGRAGVELRQGTIDVSADSRIPGPTGELSAVSWASDFHQVDGVLHLPPGWRLFHASGADEVPGTWIRTWTLLDLFLVLIVAMGVGRLWGVGWGVLALVTLVLVFPEHDAPRWSLLILLALEALVRVLRRDGGRLRTLLGWGRLGASIALALFAVTFAIGQVRGGLYPALAGRGDTDYESFLPTMPSASRAIMATSPAAAPVEQREEQIPLSLHRPKPSEPAGEGKGGDADEAGFRGAGGLGGRRHKGDENKPAQSPLSSRQYMNEYDPNAMVQTGPGLPTWNWTDVSLRFSGPVEHGQRVRLWLMAPWLNLTLAVLRVLLLGALVLLLLGLPDRLLPRLFRRGGPLVAPLALLVLLGLPHRAHAGEVPPQPMLDELQKRLLQKPTCWPHCAASPRMALEVEPHLLRARLEIGAAADSAVALPGGQSQWSPERVLVDGKPASALLRDETGVLWLELPAGSHQVLLEGALPERETVQIALPLKSHRVDVRAQGWRVEGVHEDGLADDDLQLTRVRDNHQTGVDALQPGALPPFVTIERDLAVGLQWQVDTKVRRVTPTGSAVVLEVPLLPGESVTTPEVRVQNGKALVNMAPGATEVSWHSLLQERPVIELAAPRALPWTEIWRLDASPIWHVELSGTPMVHRQNDAGATRPEWQPWPGEKVRIELTRPAGVAGRTLTIDRSDLEVHPGLRATDVTLTLSLRSSRGGQHVVTLPEGAQLQQLSIDGTQQPLRQDKRAVTIAVLPGHQEIKMSWRQPTPIGTRYVTPQVDLGAPSVNAHQRIVLAPDRWTLLCGGPRLGPAVLFWSFVLVLLLVSAALGRVRYTPLTWRQWLLLGLGLSQVPIAAAGVVAGWLLVLGWRGERPEPALSAWRYNLRQLFIAGLTLIALSVLLESIRGGLLGDPEMQISGNGSYAHMLNWFQDRAGAELPRAWVLSVPLWLYRVAMLAWALWLAGAMLRWLGWGWRAFTVGGLWRKSPPRVRTAPPAASSPPRASSTPGAPAAPSAPSTSTPPTT